MRSWTMPSPAAIYYFKWTQSSSPRDLELPWEIVEEIFFLPLDDEDLYSRNIFFLLQTILK